MIKEKRNLLNLGIVNILAMIVIYLVANFFFKSITLSSEMLGGSILILVIGLVPALLWLSFFYFLDRKDPEPLELVFAAFFAGILGEVVISGFFGKVLFADYAWTGNASAFPTLKPIFMEGIFPAVTIFFVIRYFFYPSKSFNERVDGLMYGAFVGIGYSFMSTMSDIFAVREISLYYLIFSLLLKLGVFSSLGALIGYPFGVARFREKQKKIFFLISILVACGVFSLYSFLSTQFRINISTSSDNFSIGLSAGFAIILLELIFFLIHKLIKLSEAEKLQPHIFLMYIFAIVAILIFLFLQLFIKELFSTGVLIVIGGGGSLGVLIGYALAVGIVRLRKKQKQDYFFISILVACGIYALFAILIKQSNMNISTSSDNFSIGLSAGFTIILLANVFIFIQHTIKGREAQQIEAHKFFVDIVSVIVLVLFLGSGLVIRGYIERDSSFVSQDKKVSFTLPAAFQFNGEKGGVYTFSRMLGDENNPLIVRVVFNENLLLPGILKSKDAILKAGGYTVDGKEYEKTVTLDEMNRKTFFAHVFEYTGTKNGEAVVVSIESPVANFAGHKDLALSILKSLKKEI